MKRILIFSLAYYPLVGGAEVAVKEITDRIGQNEGFEWDLITVRPNKDTPKFQRMGNVNVYRVGYFANQPINLVKETFLFKINKNVYPILASIKGLSLHSKRKYSAVWSIMASYAGIAGLFFKYFNPKVKFILTLQEGDTPEHVKRRAGVFLFLLKKIFVKADYIQAISNYLIIFAKDFGSNKEIVVIPNGVDLNKFKFTNGSTIKDDKKFKIITTSRLVEKNGIRALILSLKYLDVNFTLDILGTGPLMNDLVTLAKENKLNDRINFRGSVDQKEMIEYLKNSDVFVRPSLSEGLGNSFLEAMAMGIPIIGTKVGGIPDFLKDKETGLFCQVDDPKDIAEKISLIKDDLNFRNKLINGGLKIVTESYSWDIVVRKFKDKIFDKLDN